MDYTEMSLEKAREIQESKCEFNMKDLRGAIKAFFIALGYPDKEISMPKGQTAGGWLDKLAECIKSEETRSKTLEFLAE